MSDLKKEDEKNKKTSTLTTLSNSSIQTFNTCKRKYYFEYVLRLPRKQHDYFVLGTFVHLVLELFYKKLKENRQQKKAPLLGECFAESRKEMPEATQEILRQAKTILQDYLVRVITKQTLPDRFEMETKFNIEVQGVPVTGVIDRIDFGEGGEILIVDYKTGKKAKSKEDFAKDLQLPIYALAATKHFQVPVEKIKCQLDHLRVKKIQELIPTQETIEKATNAIVKSYTDIKEQYQAMENDKTKWSETGPKKVEGIKTHKEWSLELESEYLVFITKYAKYWEKTEGWYCSYCDFYKICKNMIF